VNPGAPPGLPELMWWTAPAPGIIIGVDIAKNVFQARP
jgi:hypothetical protein